MHLSRSLRVSVFAMVLIALAGCDVLAPTPRRQPQYPPPTFGATDSIFTDMQLRAAIFSLHARPAGFYSEDQTQTAPYYVNTWSVYSPYDRMRPWEELATDDPRQARARADSDLAYSNYTAPFDTTGPVATMRYFEFEPVPTPGLGAVRLRVHRASYIDRHNGMHIAGGIGLDGYYGALQVRPVDATAARGLAEYVWFLTAYGGGTWWKPLSSFSRASPSEVVHTIYSAGLQHDVEFGTPDRIDLLRTDYHCDASTGAVTIANSRVRSILATP